MNSRVIDEVINSWPPDFRLEGGDVEEMIRDMPDRRHMPRERPKRTPEAERSSRRDAPTSFDDRMIDVLYHAVNALREVFKKYRSEWPLSGYSVLLSWHVEHELANISFCPKIDTLVEGIPFEVSDRGMYANGPGVTFIISIPDCSLVKTVHMR